MDQSFGKAYRLCSKKVINRVFSEGRIQKKYPIKLLYLYSPLPTKKAFQIVIAVPKKKFKRAPDRNRIKRIIREIIRKNKHPLEHFLNENNQQLALFLIYFGQDLLTYAEIEIKLVRLLDNLLQELNVNTNE